MRRCRRGSSALDYELRLSESQTARETPLDAHSGHIRNLAGAPLVEGDLALRRFPLHPKLRQGSAGCSDEAVGVEQDRLFRQAGSECKAVYAAAQPYEAAFGNDLAQRAQYLPATAEVRELAGEKYVFATFGDPVLDLCLQRVGACHDVLLDAVISHNRNCPRGSRQPRIVLAAGELTFVFPANSRA